MKMVDLHCDIISRIMNEDIEANLYENNFHVDIKKLQKANSYVQFFANFLDMGKLIEKNINPWSFFNKMSDRLINEINNNEEYIKIVKSYEDIINNDKISALLTIEEGGIIDDFQKLDFVYEKGIRLITLTWNYENCIGFPNVNNHNEKGLKDYGKKLVEYMNEKKVIIDVSHLSDGGFFDVADISKTPFVASHSNSRSLRNVSRNLTDEMIKIISNKGGIIGLNYCPYFLNEEVKMTVDSLIKHIDYIINVGGEDVIALGSDFDGIGGSLEIKDVSEINKLYEGLKKHGYSERIIEKVFNKNAMMFLKEVL